MGTAVQERPCPTCKTIICMSCNEIAGLNHKCAAYDVDTEIDPETLGLLKETAKQCPKCGFFVQKNGGCNTMLCGTNSHGKITEALKNGGCGYQFCWNSMEATSTFHIDIFGNRFDGFQKENLREKYRTTTDQAILKILHD